VNIIVLLRVPQRVDAETLNRLAESGKFANVKKVLLNEYQIRVETQKQGDLHETRDRVAQDVAEVLGLHAQDVLEIVLQVQPSPRVERPSEFWKRIRGERPRR
jgi:hypothetical protein